MQDVNWDLTLQADSAEDFYSLQSIFTHVILFDLHNRPVHRTSIIISIFQSQVEAQSTGGTGTQPTHIKASPAI